MDSRWATDNVARVPVLFSRRTEIDDARAIKTLINDDSYSIFGRVNIPDLIEKCLLSLTVTDEKLDVRAYAGFSDYPNYVADTVDSVNWLDWLHLNFKIRDCSINYLNTFFLHYFVSAIDYEVDHAREIMRVFFNSLPDVHYCFLICPQGVALNEALITVFYPLAEKSDNVAWRGFITERDAHLPLMHVREAKVEDNDDLVPLLNSQTELLNATYGDYYIAELIKAQSDNMKCLVAEVEGVAVGMMSINAHFMLDLVTPYFELNSFNNFRIPHPKDRYSYDKTPVSGWRQSLQTRQSISIYRSSQVMLAQNYDESDGNDTSVYDGSVVPNAFLPKFMVSYSEMNGPEDQLTLTMDSPDRATSGHKRGTFYGSTSCICIELFAMDERFSSRSGDFLLKAYQMFPDKFYCIITVPHLVPEFPLIQRFTRVTPLMKKIVPQELYVFCSPGVLDSIKIEEASTDDPKLLDGLLASITVDYNEVKSNLEQFLSCGTSEDRKEMKAYVARVEDQPVGLAIIEREEDMERVRAHYDIEHFIVYSQHRREEHARLINFILNPIFNHYSKHFLKEILRLSGKTCLYYFRYPPHSMKDRMFSEKMTAIKDMVPVSPRRQILYNMESLGENAPSDRILEYRKPFALLHINRKLLLEPRKIINARIVVVGASDTGISFLETFIFCSNLRFNNLTLISTNGLPGDSKSSRFARFMSSHSYSYSNLNFIQMGLQNWVNVVFGKMTSIDRKEKVVTVGKARKVPYDFLILSTGTQYLITCPPKMHPLTGEVDADLNTPPGRPCAHVPNSIFVINDTVGAEKILFGLKKSLTSKKIVIYGNTLDAFCCINGLSMSGIKDKQLVFVIPPSSDKMSCFNNPDIECKVMKTLSQMSKMTVLHGHTLMSWSVDETGQHLKHVTFRDPRGENIEVPCKIVILYNHRGVDFNAFEAINCSALVFDRRLVIDANFRTNDPAIRAAGPLTKYQRIYYCEDLTHEIYNSKEIGSHLASSMMHIFDSEFEPLQNMPVNLTPTYTCPKIEGGVLPGRYSYLHVHKPKLKVPLRQEMADLSFGVVLTSGSVYDDKNGYFRLHLNKHKVVETITCFYDKGILISNIIHLYGLHHRYLNNLLNRWYEGLISNFFDYFHEPWAMILYHDRFRDFREEVRMILCEKAVVKQGIMESNLEEFIRSVLDDNYMTEARNLRYLSKSYKRFGIGRSVQLGLANYLHYNYYHLPMYAKPGMI